MLNKLGNLASIIILCTFITDHREVPFSNHVMVFFFLIQFRKSQTTKLDFVTKETERTCWKNKVIAILIILQTNDILQ